MSRPDLKGTTALVIDGTSLSRAVTVGLLNDLGVGLVFQAMRPEEGRRLIETQVFDFVFCDYEFTGTPMTGQALLDDLRAQRLLPLSTVFFMITGEASYTRVAEAVESALDNYLLKPYSPSALAERVLQCRERKLVLKKLFDAMSDERHSDVIAIAEAIAQARSRYWLFAARIGAEVALRQGDAGRARGLYESALASGYLPWARLGLAQAAMTAQDTDGACAMLESLTRSSPAYVDAHHLLGRLHLQRGEIDAALECLRHSTRLTPGSLSRLQDHGLAAFLAHQNEEAATQLERAAALGIHSKLFDSQTLMIIALLKYDVDDSPALRRYREILQSLSERAGHTFRLQRMADLFEILRILLAKKPAAALEAAAEFAIFLPDASFDFVLACGFLGVLDRIVGAEVEVRDFGDWARQLALRFCTSRGATEALLRFVDVVEGEEAINSGFAEVNRATQAAVARVAAGQAGEAVDELVAYAEITRNARVIELARLVITQNADVITDADQRLVQVALLRERYLAAASERTLGF